MKIRAIAARTPPVSGGDYRGRADSLFAKREKISELGIEFSHGVTHREVISSGLMGRASKSVPYGHLTLVVRYRLPPQKRGEGYIDTPVPLEQAYKDMQSIHREVGHDGDFISDPLKIIWSAERSFQNPIAFCEDNVDDPLRTVELFGMGHTMEIYMVDCAWGDYLDQMRRGDFRSKEVEGERIITDEVEPIEVGGHQIPIRVLRRTVPGGDGKSYFEDALPGCQRFYNDFMNWYTESVDPSRNSVTGWIGDSTRRQEAFFIDESRAETERVLRRSLFGSPTHTLAPWTTLSGSFVRREDGRRFYLWSDGALMNDKEKEARLKDFTLAERKIGEERKKLRDRV